MFDQQTVQDSEVLFYFAGITNREDQLRYLRYGNCFLCRKHPVNFPTILMADRSYRLNCLLNRV